MTKQIVYPWNTDTFLTTWEVWKEYKKLEHRFTYKTEMSEQIALKRLYNLAHGKEDIALLIIEQSIGCGYKGLFELKTNGKQTRQELHNRISSRPDWDSL